MFGSLEYFIFIFYIFKYFFKLIFIDSIVFQSFFVLYNYCFKIVDTFMRSSRER